MLPPPTPRNSSHLLNTWARQTAAADARKAAHWEEVRRKQRRAAELRAEISALEAELAGHRQNRASAESSRDGYKYKSNKWRVQ